VHFRNCLPFWSTCVHARVDQSLVFPVFWSTCVHTRVDQSLVFPVFWSTCVYARVDQSLVFPVFWSTCVYARVDQSLVFPVFWSTLCSRSCCSIFSFHCRILSTITLYLFVGPFTFSHCLFVLRSTSLFVCPSIYVIVCLSFDLRHCLFVLRSTS
jgi:hypothetical protein